MPSRYNQLLGNQEYVNTYVPLPLDTLMKAGAMKQQGFDKALEDTYKMEDLMKSVNAIDKHQQYKKELENKYYPRIEEIADQITKTGDLSKAQEIKRLARQWEHDPLRQELENSYANYKAYQTDKIKKADKYGEYYDPYLPFKGTTEAGIEGFRYTGMGEQQNHQELAGKMMDKINKDGYLSDVVNLDQAGNIIGVKKGAEFIAAKKVRSLAQGKVNSFLSTKEGEDFAKKISYYNPNIDINKAAEDYLYEAGANQIFQNSQSGSSFKYAPKYINDKLVAEEDAKNRFTTEVGATETGESWTKAAGLQDLFEEDGMVKSSTPIWNSDVVVNRNGKNEIIKVRSANDERKLKDDEAAGKFHIMEYKKGNENINLQKDTEKALTELYKRSSALGLNVIRPDGTIDGEATKQKTIDYYKGLSVYSNHTIPFIDKSIVSNISSDLFGKTPNLHNIQIYEQGDKDTKAKYENLEERAKLKGSKVIGLDYTADSPGAMKFVAPLESTEGQYGDKPYIGVSRNQTLQDQMRPVQELTKRSIEAARSGKKDPNAVQVTNMLKGTVVRDETGNAVNLESLGIPVAYTTDKKKDGSVTHRISYLDNSAGVPMIKVLEKNSNGGTSIKSLDVIQQEKTAEIFNVGGALSQYQKQSANTTLPSQDFEEEEEN